MTRRHDLDHLRAALVILVVLHHVALVYAALVPFYYVEPPFGDAVGFLTLSTFVLLNQAWFMGALFLLAGYVTPDSFDRKSAGGFLRDRTWRLALPALIFMLVLNPVASFGVFMMPASLTGITEPPDWGTYLAFLGVGPMWFAVMLLGFGIVYALWRAWQFAPPDTSERPPSFPAAVWLVAFAVGLAIVTYGWRMVVPLGRDIGVDVPPISFPTIGYLPQYASFFVIGIVARRRRWLEGLPDSAGVGGGLVALAAFVLLFPLAVSGRMFVIDLQEAAPFVGNGHWRSLVFAIWDSLTAVGLVLAALVAFRRFSGRASNIGGFLARNGYAVYILHTPIVVGVAVLARDLDWPALAKAPLVAVVVVPLVFLVAWLVRRLPLVARII